VVGLEWYPCCRLKPATRMQQDPNVEYFEQWLLKIGNVHKHNLKVTVDLLYRERF